MNINANAAALATQPAKPAPVGPKAGPSSPERTAQTLTHPAHRPGDKAHKVRTQAHKERPFKEHVQENQKAAEADQLVEGAEHAQSGDKTQAVAQAKPVQPENAANKPGAGAQKQPDDAVQTAKPAEQSEHAEDTDAKQATEAEPFVQNVVSQVMEAVDPALRFKVAPRGTSSSVNAQAASAMRTSESETKQQPAIQGADQGSTQSEPAAAETAAPSTPPARTEHAAAPIAADGGQAGSQPGQESAKPASNRRSDQVAATVDAAARASSPDAAPTRGRASLTPSLSVTVAPSMGVPTQAAAAQIKAPQANTPLPPAQQVQQAFEVAMHDLPAPAGERLVTLKMNPASLGSLRIALHVSGENVQVRFQVGSGKARAAIDESMDDLKAAVERQGLRITSVEVEEDRALTAPGGVQLDNEGRSVAPAAGETSPVTSGKGFAQLLNASPGPEGFGADTPAAVPAEHAGEGAEGGVLQVLTFRLDAVA